MHSEDTMERSGIVVAAHAGNRVTVKLVRNTACGSCGACHLGDNEKNISLTAINAAGARLGDHVQVALPTSSVLSAAFILYVLPLIGLFVGIGVSMFAGLSEGASVLVGLGILAAIFVAIRISNERFARSNKYIAEVVSIVDTTLLPIAAGCDTHKDIS